MLCFHSASGKKGYLFIYLSIYLYIYLFCLWMCLSVSSRNSCKHIRSLFILLACLSLLKMCNSVYRWSSGSLVLWLPSLAFSIFKIWQQRLFQIHNVLVQWRYLKYHMNHKELNSTSLVWIRMCRQIARQRAKCKYCSWFCVHQPFW